MQRVLLADPPRLLPAIKLPDPRRVVGPCLWEPAIEIPPSLSAKNKIIYIALGSTGVITTATGNGESVGTSVIMDSNEKIVLAGYRGIDDKLDFAVARYLMPASDYKIYLSFVRH